MSSKLEIREQQGAAAAVAPLQPSKDIVKPVSVKMLPKSRKRKPTSDATTDDDTPAAAVASIKATKKKPKFGSWARSMPFSAMKKMIPPRTWQLLEDVPTLRKPLEYIMALASAHTCADPSTKRIVTETAQLLFDRMMPEETRMFKAIEHTPMSDIPKVVAIVLLKEKAASADALPPSTAAAAAASPEVPSSSSL